MAGQPGGMPTPEPTNLPSQTAVVCWLVPVQLRAVRFAVDVPPGGPARGVKASRVIWITPEHDAGAWLGLPLAAARLAGEAASVAGKRTMPATIKVPRTRNSS